jgi:hypothetical protein
MEISMTTNHTPTPYSFSIGVRGDRYCIQATDDASAFDVAYTAPMNESGKNRLTHEKANAAFIVRACNAHAELVAALEQLADAVEADLEGDSAGNTDLFLLSARAALARAKGEA